MNKGSLSAVLDELVIYRGILKDDVINILKELFNELSFSGMPNEKARKLYFKLASELVIRAENLSLSGDILASYIVYKILRDKNVFTVACEKKGEDVSSSLAELVKKDLVILKSIAFYDFSNLLVKDPVIKRYKPMTKKNFSEELCEITNKFREWDVDEFYSKMVNMYMQNGVGNLSESPVFHWDKSSGLIPVENYDDIRFDDIIGYDYQKEIIIKNTEAFSSGKVANNMLLVGARGTGKSSSVKAVLNKFSHTGLKLIEISKSQIVDLGKLMEDIRDRGKRFIIFIDDLSFENFEVDYKHMKSILEGGVEKRPENVVIYATSNRRHLVSESWDERNNEIHENDVLNEKLSLSDRFGIRVSFAAPNQEKYLNIVNGLAQKEGINLNQEVLRRKAIEWEISQNGRSGRSARQFIDYIKGCEV